MLALATATASTQETGACVKSARVTLAWCRYISIVTVLYSYWYLLEAIDVISTGNTDGEHIVASVGVSTDICSVETLEGTTPGR